MHLFRKQVSLFVRNTVQKLDRIDESTGSQIDMGKIDIHQN